MAAGRGSTACRSRPCLQDIRKVDDSTVTFVLQRPYAPFLANLAMDFASILSKEYADHLQSAGARELLDLAPVGTGPFRLVEYRPGTAIRYEANPDYWRTRAPLDSLSFEIIPDSGVRYEKLKSGECQVIPSPNPADLAAIRADEGLALLEGEGLALSYHRLQHDRAALRPGAGPPRRGARHRPGGHRRRRLQGRRGHSRRPASATDGGRRGGRLGAV